MLEKKSLWNTEIMAQALVDSVRKLDPRGMVKNPVMFVVKVGAVLTTVLLIDNTINHRAGFGFNLQITLWLWVTVLFANFAEAMAEGRGKAQADTLRKAKGETIARRYTASNELEDVASGLLRLGDVIYVEANHYIAGDGEVIEGVASVDESAAADFIHSGNAFDCLGDLCLPQHLTVFHIKGADLAVAGARENETAGGDHRTNFRIVSAGVSDTLGGEYRNLPEWDGPLDGALVQVVCSEGSPRRLELQSEGSVVTR